MCTRPQFQKNKFPFIILFNTIPYVFLQRDRPYLQFEQMPGLLLEMVVCPKDTKKSSSNRKFNLQFCIYICSFLNRISSQTVKTLFQSVESFHDR